MNVRTSKKNTATIEVGFIVHGREELERVVKKLQQLSGVIDIERTAGSSSGRIMYEFWDYWNEFYF